MSETRGSAKAALPFRCRAIQRELVAYLDGELSRRKARRVARHLDSCTGCLAERDALDRVRGMVGELAGPSLEESAERLALARVRQAIGEGSSRGALSAWRLPALAASLGAAMIVIWQIQTRVAPKPVEVASERSSSEGVVAQTAVGGGKAEGGTGRGLEPEKGRSKRAMGVKIAKRGRSDSTLSSPPGPLYENPELFLDLPLVLDLEKLEEFEAVMQALPGSGRGPKARGTDERG